MSNLKISNLISDSLIELNQLKMIELTGGKNIGFNGDIVVSNVVSNQFNTNVPTGVAISFNGNAGNIFNTDQFNGFFGVKLS